MQEPTFLDELPEVIAKAENLPSPPRVATQVVSLAGKENVTVDEIAEIISHDPVLSAKLLRLANSAFFSRGQEITSLYTASMHLGMKTVKLMALSFSLATSLPRKGKTRGFNYYAYWYRSVVHAVASRALSRLTRSVYQDEAFLCGLLGRIGQLVMAQCVPEDYENVLEETDGFLPKAESEFRALGFNFHQIGSALMKSWSFPSLIARTLHHWGDPNKLSDEADEMERGLVHVVHVADHVCSVLCDSEKGPALQETRRVAEEYLDVSEEELDACIIGMEQDVNDAADLLSMDIDTESYESILEEAHAQLTQLSLETAIDLQHTTARADQLEREKRQLEDVVGMDKLTGLPNRARFDELLLQVVGARVASKSSTPLGLLIIDLDHFKRVNDNHGHLVGDDVLRLVAGSMKSSLRGTDIVARYGGEEFVSIVPNITLSDLRTVAERVRKNIATTALELGGGRLWVTVSVGGACARRLHSMEDGMRLLGLADECLYKAKNSGRNRCVCTHLEPAEESGRRDGLAA
jgi:diguanylate cyclase (GGDEF)-like protein